MTNTSPFGPDLQRTEEIKVVIADDSDVLRQRVAESLSAIPGVRVAGQASDGPEGLALVEELKPEVLILDIEMPSLSGMEVLKLAKERDNPPVVMMLSIYSQPLFRRRCAELGADHYFNKLTEFDGVARVCRELAERRTRNNENRACTD
jgi:DNA-binding NarL/FixJ family response regulator